MPGTLLCITLHDVLDEEDFRHDILSGELFACGAVAIENKNILNELGREQSIWWISFEDDRFDALTIVELEELLVGLSLSGRIEQKEAPEIDWTEQWKQHFPPLDFGDLWIFPPWAEPKVMKKYNLKLEPSMAFGTGLHPTTRLCVDRILALRPAEYMLDLGSGSGILAFVAALKGAQHTVGVEIDSEAVAVAEKNKQFNNLDESIHFFAGTLEDFIQSDLYLSASKTFDLIAANILAGPLLDLAEELLNVLQPGGTLLLSGILKEQTEQIIQRYTEFGAKLVNIIFLSDPNSLPALGEESEPREEWALIELSK